MNPIIRPTRERETQLHQSGFTHIAGVDEAGRGPLAGPVVAAAALLPRDFPLEQFSALTDSKQLTHAQRAELLGPLQKIVAWGVGIVDAQTIDEINIRQASWLAMQRAVANMQKRGATFDYVLLDGLAYGAGPWPYEAIVKGDARELCIAAASIIAKETRDTLMIEYDTKYSNYGFAQHKGYGTPQHLRALQEHGACAIHRKTFAPVRAVLVD